jgi:HK97 family phage major capsid protein
LEEVVPDLTEVLAEISQDLKLLQGREGSKYVGERADPEYARSVAEAQRRKLTADDWRGVKRYGEPADDFVTFLRDVKAARQGDPGANKRLERKTWNEGGDGSTGGFLIQPEMLPKYVEARRAAAPLAARCSHFATRSDAVTIVVEGDAVQVVPTAESSTLLETTGSLGVKVATTFKLAGLTRSSDELLADSGGAIESLIRMQLIRSHDIVQDSEIVAGSGSGQVAGILNTVGVVKTPVDGQTGGDLWDSIVKALARRQEMFYPADTVALHPRDLVRFRLARDSTGRPLFGSLREMFPEVELIADANIPTTLGVSGTESVAILGDFKSGCYLWERQPPTIDASSDAGFVTGETLWRLTARWGFSVVQPTALEVLTEILPS